MKQVTIGVNEDGQRVDRIVSKLLSGAGKGLVYKAIRKKIVTLGEKRACHLEQCVNNRASYLTNRMKY